MTKMKKIDIVMILLSFLLAYAALRIEAVSIEFKNADFSESISGFECLKAGLSYEDVEKCLGKPDEIVRAGRDDYYVRGYAKRERQITGMVYIYIISFEVCYVYFGTDGLVEDFYIGGS